MKGKLNALTSAILLVFLIGFAYSATYSGDFDIGIGEHVEECSPEWHCTLTPCTGGFQTWFCTDYNQCDGATYPSNHGETVSCSLCGDGICNGGETCSTCSADCGSCPSTGGSGGGGGGGSSTTKKSDVLLITSPTNSGNSDTCVEDWVCGTWSDSGDQCGTRICTDTNDCGTTDLKPATAKECPVGFFSTMFSFLTGGVIGASSEESKGLWIGPVILLILIIAGLGILIFRKRKK